MYSKEYHQTELGKSQQAMAHLIKPGSCVLEVGCGTGYMTRALKEDLGCRVTVVEIDPGQASKAESFADEVIVGDIENPETWAGLISGSYDVVVFGDVLEHLKDPWETLRRAKGILGDKGRVLASIPNVAYYEVRWQLLLGKFEYVDYGILDNSHLRFFTAHTARQLFEKSGYRVLRFERIFNRMRHRLFGKAFPNACALQFIIEAHPNNAVS